MRGYQRRFRLFPGFDILTFVREDDAMVELGVGKNMVRSIRFWAEAAGVISAIKEGHELTDFGQ